MKNIINGFYRPAPAPSDNIPLGARSVGHYVIDESFQEKPEVKHFVEIFWGIKGTGIFLIDGVEKKLTPGKIAVYFPGMLHNLRTESGEWEYRWWTMDGILASSITASFGLDYSGIYQAGQVPSEIFRDLEEAVTDNTAAGERLAGAIAYKLLTYATGRVPEKTFKDLPIKKALEIINKEWANPQIGIEIIADRVGLDRTVFSKRFSSETGVSPIKYISSLRVQNALSQLKYSKEKISVIARKCGWQDANYFARCIKKATGMPPEKFRAS